MNFFKVLIFLLVSVVSTNVLADFVPFNTVQQAQQNCPSVVTLKFVANSRIKNSSGFITGIFNGVLFGSIPGLVAQPQNMSSAGIIQNVQLRQVNNMYGYTSNNVTSCFYYYPTFTGVLYNLVLRQK